MNHASRLIDQWTSATFVQTLKASFNLLFCTMSLTFIFVDQSHHETCKNNLSNLNWHTKVNPKPKKKFLPNGLFSGFQRITREFNKNPRAMEGNSHGSTVELQDLNGFLGQDDSHGIMVLDVTRFMPQRPAWWIKNGPVFLCWNCYQGESQLIRIICTFLWWEREGRIHHFYAFFGLEVTLRDHLTWLENGGPGLKMYFLFKMGIFRYSIAMLEYERVLLIIVVGSFRFFLLGPVGPGLILACFVFFSCS